MGKKQTKSRGDGDKRDNGVAFCLFSDFKSDRRTILLIFSFGRFWPGTANKLFLEGLSESLFLRGGRQQVIWGLFESKSPNLVESILLALISNIAL
jgi:hypothetical protein